MASLHLPGPTLPLLFTTALFTGLAALTTRMVPPLPSDANFEVCEESVEVCQEELRGRWGGDDLPSVPQPRVVAATSDGRVLFVGITGGGCSRPRGVTVKETDESVTVTSLVDDTSIEDETGSSTAVCFSDLIMGVHPVTLDRRLGERLLTVKQDVRYR